MNSTENKILFDPSRPIGLKIVEIPSPLHFHGLELTTTKKDLFKDAARLAREFSEKGSEIVSKKATGVYATITFQPDSEGKIRYFIGKQTGLAGEQKGFTHVAAEPGIYANLKVKSRPGWYLPYRLAKVRQTFHQTFLPQSPYRLSDLIEEIEYYNAESRLKYFEKPAMYLLFPLEQSNII